MNAPPPAYGEMPASAAPPGFGYPPPGYAPYPYRPPGPPPPSRIGWAITALILFWPLAIPAFIYSGRVESSWNRGDVAGAERASQNAKTCGVVALVIGVVIAALMIVLFAAVFDVVEHSDTSGGAVRVR
jgi:hypothetical protein